ncbi:DUF397 domain-containing protein [Actinopolyspora mortivallis]|uniref:DUF397 domain-containing protein n=1 Tax=Actinopolyspora mortivallis TaxID=33906 RepID=A0A2T0GTB4_ACTMO|nr:DUF397 domain-containing protein [Actinopolyspora mortivallis]PRW62356.1 DUF397 domain-containing protein [Actinopolyspora mortivallis]
MFDWSTVVWRKSSFSDAGGNCVEVASCGDVRGLRDGKLGKSGPVLVLDASGFGAFLNAVRAGRFDR